MQTALRVLLVDDNPDDRRLVVRALQQELPHCELREARDQAELDRALEEGGLSLVVTDYHLRWSDGLRVLQAVKARWPEVPVVMFTGTGTEEVAVAAIKAGLDDYVLKSPQHFQRLPAVVRSCLERARQRAEALEAAVRYREFFEALPIGAYRSSFDGRFLAVNPALVELLGYPDAKTLLATPAREVWSDPAERDVWIDHVRRHGAAKGFPLRLRRRDGTILWAENTARLFRDGEGREAGVEGTTVDVTARREAEEARQRLAERLEHVVDALPLAILLLGREGDIQVANRLGQEYLPLLSRAEIGGRVLSLGGLPLAKLSDPPPEGRTYHKIVVEGEPRRIFGALARPLPGPEAAEGWAVAAWEETREHEIREKAALQDRMAAVGHLAAGIAHDFNNILTAILGYAELLEASPGVPEPVRDKLQTVTQQSLRAADLVRQILDFSRGAASEKHPLDLFSFTKESLRFLERLLPERIRVELRREPGNAWVEANPAQLQQILTNLLVNARDAIPGDGRITVSVGPVRFGPGGVPVPRMAPGDYAALSVSDTGTGMTPEVRERLFEPFFTTKARGTGTGLGLTQVYGLVEQHRGHIAVESRVGHGTTFTVYLPAASVSSAPEPANGPVAPQGRGRAVLVAEDDASVMAIVQALLERLGFGTLAARTGAEALALYGKERGRIALVMTDLAMPEMGGRELCQALKDQDPALPVIGMSGYAQGTDPLACGTHRFDRILTKPMSLKELSAALDAALDPTP